MGETEQAFILIFKPNDRYMSTFYSVMFEQTSADNSNKNTSRACQLTALCLSSIWGVPSVVLSPGNSYSN